MEDTSYKKLNVKLKGKLRYTYSYNFGVMDGTL